MKFNFAVLFAISAVLSVMSRSTACPCTSETDKGPDRVNQVNVTSGISADRLDVLEEYLNKTLHYMNKNIKQIENKLPSQLFKDCKKEPLPYFQKPTKTFKMHKVHIDVTTTFFLVKGLLNKTNQIDHQEIMNNFYTASCKAEDLAGITKGGKCRHVKKAKENVDKILKKQKGAIKTDAGKVELECVVLHQARKVLETIYTNVKEKKNLLEKAENNKKTKNQKKNILDKAENDKKTKNQKKNKSGKGKKTKGNDNKKENKTAL